MASPIPKVNELRLVVLALSVFPGFSCVNEHCPAAGVQQATQPQPASEPARVALVQRKSCPVAPQRNDAGTTPLPQQPVAVALFTQWPEFWVLPLTGQKSTFERYRYLGVSGHSKWAVVGTAHFDENSRELFAETRRDWKSLLVKAVLFADFSSAQTAAMGRLSRTYNPEPVQYTDDFVVVLDRTRDFFARYERMLNCSNDALTEAR